jgi:hypothetical protein
MTSLTFLRLVAVTALAISAIPALAQTSSDTSAATVQIPRLIRLNGTLKVPPAAETDARAADVTFALYTEETGGEPLWQETQKVEVDESGHYNVLLGSTVAEGLPVELFTSAQAQWLGIQRPGEAEQPRIMLVSVPFALKAGDAETFGGKPPSAYALAGLPGTGPRADQSQSAVGSEPLGSSNAHPLALTGTGTVDYLPMWTSTTALGSSPIFENKTSKNLGIGTTAPTAALEVLNNTEAPMLAQTNGKNLNAVQGTNLGTTGGGAGVYGTSSTPTGSGVYGTASAGEAVGVWGVSSAASGNGNGVYGVAASPGSYAAGVWGHSSAGGGNGTVGSCAGTDGCTGVWGYSSGTTGTGWGVYGQSLTGPGAVGQTSGAGQSALIGRNKAQSGNSNGLYADTYSVDGVGAFIDNAGGGYILVGTVDNNGTHMFHVDGSGNGYFAGKVNSGGTFTSGIITTEIDHPLDPANKTLSNAVVESPEMKNIYDGNVTTDKAGLATVVLPDYVETLNRDFRYQITVIGQFAQAIVAKKIANNRFVIQTSVPNVEVSWQVTGIRQDPWANAHRVQNEAEKPANFRGYYLHPEVYGAGEDRSIKLRIASPVPQVKERDPNPSKAAVSSLPTR